MAEYNPSTVIQRLPDCIERIEATHFQKMDQTVEFFGQMAKASGDKQFIDAYEGLMKNIPEFQAYTRRMIGKEGDTTSEEGSLWSFVTTAKKIQKVMGGDT